MKTAIVTLIGSTFDTNLVHAIVDLCDLSGYREPWFSDDCELDDTGRGEVVLTLYPGFCEDSFTQKEVKRTCKRWGVRCSLVVEDDEEVDA